MIVGLDQHIIYVVLAAHFISSTRCGPDKLYSTLICALLAVAYIVVNSALTM